MFTRRKLPGKQLAGAKAFAANPDECRQCAVASPQCVRPHLAGEFCRLVGLSQFEDCQGKPIIIGRTNSRLQVDVFA